MLARVVRFAVPLIACVALVACSDKPSAPPATTAPAAAPAQPAANAQAAKSLAMYRELLQSKSYELAGPIGQEIVQKYPGTPEADEVKQTLDDAVAKGTAIATKRRVERLWIYQEGTESGGNQVTASIYDSAASAADRVRLVLRRHSDWGQSVYLFADGSKGFDCAKPCSLATHFDAAAPVRLGAHLPTTGEPAIFLTDDKDFIARMGKAEKVTFDVVLKGKGPRTLVYEVGGFDASKFGTPAKPSAAAKGKKK
jgi:hypothetical protein